MTEYLKRLQLKFDPFAPGTTRREFFAGGGRQEILDRIIELILYGNSSVQVIGELGSGKSTLARTLANSFGEEALCVSVSATLFMNRSQFTSALIGQLPLDPFTEANEEQQFEEICRLAHNLEMEAQTLVIVLDEAHEASSEVIEFLFKLRGECPAGSVHWVLLGEAQLANMLEKTSVALPQQECVTLELAAFGSKDTADYVRFKLAEAGYKGELPVSGGDLGEIHNVSLGIPGSINAMMADALQESGSSINELQDEEVEPGDTENQAANKAAGNDSVGPLQLNSGDMLAIFSNIYARLAAGLTVLLLVLIFLWQGSDQQGVLDGSNEVASENQISIDQDIAIADVESELAQPANEEPPLPVVAEATTSPEPEVTETVSTEDAGNLAQAVEIDHVVDSDESAQVDEEAVAQSATTPEVTIDKQEGSFADQLLEAEPGHYTIQLLAAHSEDNIRAFVEASTSLLSPLGYFETRYRDRPWFVVVAGDFSDQASAKSTLEQLPPAIRQQQPWIRSMASVQSDLQALRR